MTTHKENEFNLSGIYSYKDLLDRLNGGLRFGEVMEYRDGTKNIHIVLRADERYIYWHHYGSSANSTTERDMKFVIEQIFRMDLPTFIRKYVFC